ncbi:AraC family transcriptional regulator [Hymenobacter terrenus]|uniref:AraC family transcriptional regulator n=1 Tax=Hymenobacter terrenus TaxID=1629124 RepID=UPI00061A0303|nr:helix-turn-helix domain-containing protein [Hymenobacter terrenus]
MNYCFHDPLTEANLVLNVGEPHLEHSFFAETRKAVLTVVWNRGPDQYIWLDGEPQLFPAGCFAPLTMNQTFRFERARDVVSWQFDKPLYCIEDNDREVSCVGFLFWGQRGFLTIAADAAQSEAVDLLLRLFVSEFEARDPIQGEMLRALLKRLLLTLNRLAKAQNLHAGFQDADLDIVRRFNVLVEKNFRRLHQVQDYAELLHKSPKTLANLFGQYNNQTPLAVIHARVVLEAKRLLLYTDSSVKEIAYQLGFEDVSHFSRLFKKSLGLTPGELRAAPARHLPGFGPA